MLLVTGGFPNLNTLATTEVYNYSGDGPGSWRSAGQLPTARYELRAARVGQILHVSGGNGRDEILSFDPVSETWSLAGRMTVGRYFHAVVEIPVAVMAGYCR